MAARERVGRCGSLTEANQMRVAYQTKLDTGALRYQAEQEACVAHLDALADRVTLWRSKRSGILNYFGQNKNKAPRGLYIHGPVGRGKTMLMDLFYDTIAFGSKRRIHFHEFMAEVHERIADARQREPGDPLPVVAKLIAGQARLLCFDELHVTDIADAMILGRLFSSLFDEGVVVVATSNARPDALYRNGLNRDRFVPFIDMIQQRMDVVSLAGPLDFRLEKLSGQRLYFTPLDDRARAGMDALWSSLAGEEGDGAVELEIKGRIVTVPQAANGVARFSFEDLCARPLGASDYLSIARAFHTVMVDDIPVLTSARRNEARRFINLVDTLYDAKVSLIASAAAEAHELYVEGDGVELFERTVSRLIEMRSDAYLNARAERLTALELDAERPSGGAASVG